MMSRVRYQENGDTFATTMPSTQDCRDIPQTSDDVVATARQNAETAFVSLYPVYPAAISSYR